MYNNQILLKWTVEILVETASSFVSEGLGWASLNTGLHSSLVVMVDLRGSSVNT